MGHSFVQLFPVVLIKEFAANSKRTPAILGIHTNIQQRNAGRKAHVNNGMLHLTHQRMQILHDHRLILYQTFPLQSVSRRPRTLQTVHGCPPHLGVCNPIPGQCGELRYQVQRLEHFNTSFNIEYGVLAAKERHC